MSAFAHRLLEPVVPDRPLEGFAADAVAGLTAPRKHLPAKYFYDARGSALFEAITRLPEYYPTRTERAILAERAADIAARLPGGGALIEFGSGSTAKVRTLLPHLPGLAAYVPVDVSGEYLRKEAARLQRDFPGLRIRPVIADFTAPFALPPEVKRAKRAGFFPGSTIGNFEPAAAIDLLAHFGDVLGTGATLVIGVDLVKDEAVLEAAYDDAAGVTAAFNLNLLARMNRELDGGFDLGAFAHRAFYDARRGRIEMHLVSRRRQTVEVCGVPIRFEAGETIHTENSYKYTLEGFAQLAREAGWESPALWRDPQGWFAIFGLRKTE